MSVSVKQNLLEVELELEDGQSKTTMRYLCVTRLLAQEKQKEGLEVKDEQSKTKAMERDACYLYA